MPSQQKHKIPAESSNVHVGLYIQINAVVVLEGPVSYVEIHCCCIFPLDLK